MKILPSRQRDGERDKRPKVETPDDRMTLTEHLAELRSRIIRSLLAVVVGIVVVLAFYNPILDFLKQPYVDLCEDRGPDFCSGQLVGIGPLDGFTTRLSVATYGGIVIALPVILWQAWKFVVPALHAKEKRYAVPFVTSAVALFGFGAFLAYFTLGKALEFLIEWSGDDVEQVYPVSKYISLLGMMVAAFGIGMLFPVPLVFLQLVGALTPQTLIKGWRYAILVVFVIAAVITPSGDPYSMLSLALPMCLFYVISVVIGLVVQRRRRASGAAV